MKAVILSRVSTEIQDYTQQTNEVINVVMSDGYSKDDIILIEDKESGVKLSENERLGLNKLKDTIEKEPLIDCCYVYEVSRIGRQQEVNLSVRNFLQQHRVQLIILKPYIKVFNQETFQVEPSANLIFSVMNTLAENEGYLRKERLKRGKQHKKEQGLWFGGRHPYGYTTNKQKQIIPEPKEQTVIRRVYDMFLNQGMSTYKIGRELKLSGHFDSKLSDQVCMNKVCIILNSRLYIGEDKRFNQIVSEEQWEQGQEKLKTKRTHCGKQQDLTRFWLKGLVVNGDDNQNYTIHSKINKYKTVKGKSVDKDILHKVVGDMINSYTLEHKQSSSDIKNSGVRKIQLLERKIYNSNLELIKMKEKQEKIWVRNIEGKINDTKAQTMSDQIDVDMNLTRSEIIKWEQEKTKVENETQSLLQQNKNDIDFNSLSDETKKEQVNKLINKVVIRKNMETRKKIVTIVFKDETIKSGEIIR